MEGAWPAPGRRAAVAVLLLALLACACSTAAGRALQPQQQQQQQRPQQARRRPLAAQQAPVLVSFSELKPALSAVWVPEVSADQAKLQVPVSGVPGTPSTKETMSRVKFTVSFTRRPAYLVSGTLSIAPAAFSSTDGTEGASFSLAGTPAVLLTQQGVADAQAVPPEAVKCSGSAISAAAPLTCSFTARIFALTVPPPPGSAQALVNVTSSFQSKDEPPTQIQTPAAAYDFAGVATGAGSNARFASPEATQRFLQDTMGSKTAGGSDSDSGSATVTNYFEPGEGRVVPAGVLGVQPAANSVLKESATYTYTAFIADVPRESCGKKLQIVNSATIETTSDGVQPSQATYAAVDLVLLGCDTDPPAPPAALAGDGGQATPPAAAAAPAPAPPAAAPAPAPSAAVPAVPAGATTPAAPVIEMPPLPGAAPAAPAAAPAAPAAPTTEAVAPPGVFMAAAGTKLCGPVNICTPEQTCIDNLVCCAAGERRCGSSCCGPGSTCIADRCVAPGGSVCGAGVCAAGQTCLGGRCCGGANPACGSTCCNGAAGEVCVAGQCAAAGAKPCSGQVCGPDQTCVSGVCCRAGESACGATCCGAGTTCLSGACVPAGSTLCSGLMCPPGHTCTSGGICCEAGASFCGGQCCGGGNTCQQGRCIPSGSQVCGENVCQAGQQCTQGVCCNAGEQACSKACCPAGNVCLVGQCVPAGSQACGTTTCPHPSRCADPMRNQCCPFRHRGCGPNCCPPGHGCSWSEQCVRIGDEAGQRMLWTGSEYGWGEQSWDAPGRRWLLDAPAASGQ